MFLFILLSTIVVNLYAPSCGGYTPAIVGTFNGWQSFMAMTPQTDGAGATYYTYTFSENVSNNSRFKFVAAGNTGWHNELVYLENGTWHIFNDIHLYDVDGYTPDSSQMTLSIDFSSANYSYEKCTKEEDEEPEPIVPDYSGTLPVVYIHTLNGQDITSKEDYVSARLYIDPLETGASVPGPDTIEIRGRGNYTWTGFAKKPYKIKFSSKTSVLGMPKSKHWALMAAADDNMGFLKNPVGYYLSKQIGLRWTPSCVPVEVVINGMYNGLYFLTETVRLEGKRAQGDWLVEIDNYMSDGQVYVTEENGQSLMITPSEPDSLSESQFDWLYSQMNDINNAIYAEDSEYQVPTTEEWTSRIDLTECVRYYLVNEIMLDCESYHGSCYLHYDAAKDGRNASDSLWYFGPVWDFGNALNKSAYGGGQSYIYENPQFEQYWIGQIASRAEFQVKLAEEWYRFYHEVYPTLSQAIDSIASGYSGALAYDAAYWRVSNVHTYTTKAEAMSTFVSQIDAHIQWLHNQWGEGTAPTSNHAISCENSACLPRKTLRNGRVVIVRNGQTYTLTGQKQ